MTERVGLDDIISVSVLQQNRLRWYGHLLQKEDNDWMKKCVEYEVESARPKRTWQKVMQNYQARKLIREDAMDCSRCRKLIKDG